LAELRSLLQKDERVNLFAISVDKPEESREFAQKIAADGQGEVKFSMLSDPDHKVIDGYGLRDPAYAGQKFDGIPRPSVYVLDKTGRVNWRIVEEDFHHRPDNQVIRAALEPLK